MNSNDAKPDADRGLSWLFRVQVAGGAFFLLVALGVMLAFLSNSNDRRYQCNATVAISDTVNLDDIQKPKFIEFVIAKRIFMPLESFKGMKSKEIVSTIAENISVTEVAGKHGSFEVSYVSSSQQDSVIVLGNLLEYFPISSNYTSGEFVVVKAAKDARLVGQSNGVRMLIGGACGALLSLLLTPIIFRVLR